jgi:hypothetical protein
MRLPHPLAFVFALSIGLWCLPFWASGCLATPTPVVQDAPPQPPAIEIVRPSNPLSLPAVVDLPQGWGSCVPVHSWHDFTVFLTSRHVIEAAHGAPFWVRLDPKSPRLPVVRAEVHPTLDAGLLLVQVRVPVVELSEVPLEFGDRIICSSWIYCGDPRRTVSEGIVSQWDTCSASVYPGMSGGGIFRDGRLVGIVEAVAVDQNGPWDRGVYLTFVQIFTPVSRVRPWIEGMLPR